MGTQDDIDRLKAEENKAKGRLGFVEKQYRELRDESPAGRSAKELDARDEQIGRLTSERTNLEITRDVREAQRHELERGRDAAERQAGAPQRSDVAEESTERPSLPDEQLRPLDASQDAKGSPAVADEPAQAQQPDLAASAPGGAVDGRSPQAPDATVAQPSSAMPDATQRSAAEPEKAKSNLEPFEPPAPEGYFIGRSRERTERFFKPMEDVERIKAEQDLCERYKAEVTDLEKEIVHQRTRMEEEMKKLGLDQSAIDKFRKIEFDSQKEQFNTLRRDQKEQLQEIHSLSQVADETLRPEQTEKREASQRSMDQHWFEVTERFCIGPATTAVEQHTVSMLADESGRLDWRGVDGKEKEAALQKYAQLLDGFKEGDIQKTAALLQQEAFPEIVANGPQFVRTSPSIDVPQPQQQALPPPGPSL